jgi:vacuolar-type H+-ATPase subunit H
VRRKHAPTSAILKQTREYRTEAKADKKVEKTEAKADQKVDKAAAKPDKKVEKAEAKAEKPGFLQQQEEGEHRGAEVSERKVRGTELHQSIHALIMAAAGYQALP